MGDGTEPSAGEGAKSDRDDLPRHVLDGLLEGCQVIGPDFTYLYVNDAVARQGRKKRAQLLGRTMMDAYPGIEQTAMFEVLRNCMEQRTTACMENEFIFPDGSIGWFELRFEPVPDGVAILSLDITQRKGAEEALRRSRRALSVLSDTNQTLVRAEDEAGFMRDVCRIAVERGGYLLAWIGLGEAGSEHAVQPVARAGNDEGFVDAECLLAHEDHDESGLVGRTMVTAQTHVARNLGEDRRSMSRHRQAAERGFGSAIALPIRIQGRCVGALAIYAAEADAFDVEERALLEEMALDLGHGLATLRAERTRREVQRKYATLLGNLPGMAYRCRNDRDWTMEIISGGCLELTGYSPEDVIENSSLSYAHIIHPDDRDRVRDEVEVAVADGKRFVLEYRITTAGGEERWVWEQGTPILSDSGQVAALEGFILDITSRKRAEAQTEVLNDRLLRLARVVQALSGARGIDQVTKIVRKATRDLVGSDGATFILQDGDQCHYVDEDAIAPLWKGKKFPLSACISGWSMLHRCPAVIEDIYADDRIPHDAYRPTFVRSLVMVPIRSDDPVGAIGAYWAYRYRASTDEVHILQALADSTSVALENIRVLGELKRGEARFRAVYDHLPNATFLWRRQSEGVVLTDFNAAAKAAMGGSVTDILGKSAPALCDYFPSLDEDLERCFQTRAPVRREVDCNLSGSDARQRMVLTYGFLPPDMAILHTEDITNQRRTEQQLQASQRLEAIGRLAGGVAHDFNNLLTVINSYTAFAIDALPESHPVRSDLIEVLTAGERGAALTRQLLAFGRKQILEPVILDLNEVVRGVERMLRRLLGEDIDIMVVLADGLGNVEADPSQVEQVIMNLAVNARDAMPQGGKLTIETANVELDEQYAEKRISVRPGQFVRLSISDTGCGMAATTRERIFEPFFSTKEHGKGTGLGLATVYGVIKQSGGHIWVYSEPGHGSTFKVYLPQVDVQPLETKRRPASLSPRGNETVLIVEDETPVRKIAERVLTTAGYRVLTAATPREALLLCEEHAGEIELLLTDVVMPEMGGRDLAERVSKLNSNIKVLYMSGYTDNAIVHHGVLDREARFIAKPFTFVTLTRKVREVLDEPVG